MAGTGGGASAAATAVRVTGGAVSAALAVTGALHAVWAVTPWPLRTPEEFADAVVGTGDGVPPAGACLAVAGLLGAASYLVAAEAGVLPAGGSQGSRRAGASPAGVRAVAGVRRDEARRTGVRRAGARRAGVRAVAGVLLARGVAGPVLFGRVSARTERFRRLNVRYYSPLCVVLGAGAAAVGWRGSSATNC
ncbi:DUF3995 domain-containing protein [Kitasatospora sp. NPDC048194]|uniref:DUF3995 domain-containing protein n=1 Tax=Kitasatospora sp. NPDC048194 TaxID=3364045 RepID=UPI00372106D4